jgi:hypothetical protein
LIVTFKPYILTNYLNLKNKENIKNLERPTLELEIPHSVSTASPCQRIFHNIPYILVLSFTLPASAQFILGVESSAD